MKLVVIEIDNFTESDVKAALGLLPAERQEELLRLRDPADLSRSLVAELAVRLEIMQTLCVSGGDIRILRAENQKPRLENFQNFHFNISHSGEFAVCAFDSFPVGVDVEKVRPIDSQRLAAHFFSPREQAALGRETDPHVAFFRLWTVKESVIKQRGATLARDLKRLDVAGGVSLDGELLPCRVSSHWLARGARVLLENAGEYALSLCRAKEAEDEPQICFCTAGEIIGQFLKMPQ